jgi:NADP-dependent 3-hydroxy acid dehydrogenase YdfG
MAKKPTKVEEKLVKYDEKAKVVEEWVGERPIADGIKSSWWKIQPEDIAQIILDLLAMPTRTLPSRVEVRPSQPHKK